MNYDGAIEDGFGPFGSGNSAAGGGYANLEGPIILSKGAKIIAS